jgi:hypothetical protein
MFEKRFWRSLLDEIMTEGFYVELGIAPRGRQRFKARDEALVRSGHRTHC